MHIAGILGGLLWIGLAYVHPQYWGEPGTGAYMIYEAWNRLWPPALIGMGLGFYGFFKSETSTAKGKSKVGRAFLIGFAMMVVGNVSEFWLFTDLPYGSLNLRSMAWITFLMGFLTVVIASAIYGLARLGKKKFPQWLAGAFSLTAAASIILFFIDPTWAFSLIGGLSVLVGWNGLRGSWVRKQAG